MRIATHRLLLFLGIGFGGLAVRHAAADAAGFRGDGSGRFAAPAAFLDLAKPEGVVWIAKLPSWSNSSPVPAGDPSSPGGSAAASKVFVGCEPFGLACLNARDGALLWLATNDYVQVVTADRRAQLDAERALARQCEDLLRQARDRINSLSRDLAESTNRTPVVAKLDEVLAQVAQLKEKWTPTPLEAKYRLPGTHGGTGYSTASPLADASRVWALFGNGIAACYTHAGERKWIRLVDKPRNGHGHSASPLLADGRLILAINDLRALNPDSGEPVWTAPCGARFGTPAVTSIGGHTVLVTAGGEIVRASDGKVLAKDLGGASFNGPIVHERVVFFFDERDARAYELPAQLADTVQPKLLWKTAVARDRYYASPVWHGGLVYGITSGGTLTALDAATGAKAFEKPVNANRGACYASLAAAGGHVYSFTENGGLAVVKEGRDGEPAATSKASDGLRSSPVFAGERLFVRTMAGVTCYAATPAAAAAAIPPPAKPR
jgi:outer membrane protein assembly factor BamB